MLIKLLPSRRELVRGALPGAAVVALLWLGWYVWPRSAYQPIEAANVRSYLLGTMQKFVVDLTVREVCGHVLFDRSFLDITRETVFRKRALRAPFDPEPVVAVQLPVGVYKDLTWEYAAEPGLHGTFRIWASPSECPSGFNQTYSLFNAAYDWRGVVP